MIKKIEQISTKELEEILTIWLTANIEAHTFIPESYWQENIDFVREQLPQADLYVYKETDKIVAFLGMNETYIAGIFVLNAYRNQGIGQKLLDAVKHSSKTLSLNVYAKNQNALKFYTKQGFRVVSEQLDTTGELEYKLVWES
ncbi:GNAT family N-acetyltransferase [Enterococcus quebecensis]|uniref:GNAT family N-acetyltransferase n=1 Tax=Enterococcus quebecensis TaxID=903983 RepID=A0A1E5GUE4_9ENTE|nr:GNAT family N-acetyltransferase [Enterococcus quebecensis]OEG16287.1 GNAT family N-acetyltransferase [Enterococcus quebecensis]OJG74439.1 hypothetical protein RV12_GL002496 [Enterococcus quebecensis]